VNLRKLRRQKTAATSTVESSPTSSPPGASNAPALPPGDAPPAPAPAPDAREIPIEPLRPAEPGRDEARAAFVRDAGGVTPDAPPSDDGAPEAASTPRAGHGEMHDAQPAVTVDGVTEQAVAMLDGLGTMLGPRFVGGGSDVWALDEKERGSLRVAGRPLVAKAMESTNITPEALFLGTLAFVYVPRALVGFMTSAAEKKARSKNETRAAYEVPTPPPAESKPPGATTMGATQPPPAPAPEAAPAPPAPPPAPAAPRYMPPSTSVASEPVDAYLKRIK